MRILNAATAVGSLILIGMLAVAVSQPALASGSDVSIRLAAANDPATDKDTYSQKAQDEMREWQRKLHDFSVKTKAEGQEAGNAADNDLNQAWRKAEAASRDLQAAGADGWESAKTSYERASHDLANTWNKVRPQGE
jgi:hypothetical protein